MNPLHSHNLNSNYHITPSTASIGNTSGYPMDGPLLASASLQEEAHFWSQILYNSGSNKNVAGKRLKPEGKWELTSPSKFFKTSGRNLDIYADTTTTAIQRQTSLPNSVSNWSTAQLDIPQTTPCIPNTCNGDQVNQMLISSDGLHGDNRLQAVGVFHPHTNMNQVEEYCYSNLLNGKWPDRSTSHLCFPEASKQAQQAEPMPLGTESATKTKAISDEKRKKPDQHSSNVQSSKAHIPKEKLSILQQIVSPYGKTDTASILQETIQHIRRLHEQVQDCIPRGNVDIRRRGLCLVPISCIPEPYKRNPDPDYLIPPFKRSFYS